MSKSTFKVSKQMFELSPSSEARVVHGLIGSVDHEGDI